MVVRGPQSGRGLGIGHCCDIQSVSVRCFVGWEGVGLGCGAVSIAARQVDTYGVSYLRVEDGVSTGAERSAFGRQARAP